MLAAYCLWFGLGLLGGHRFYLGRPVSAVAMAALSIGGVALATSSPPVAGLMILVVLFWWVIDLLFIPRFVRRSRPVIGSVAEKITVTPSTPLPVPAAALIGNAPAESISARTSGSPEAFNRAPVLSGGAAQAGRMLIDYADADGVVTEREIEILSAELSDNALYINAFCHLRHSERTFRVDRILSARKQRGAPQIADIEAYIVDFLPPDKLPDPRHDAVMGKVASTLSILVWIAYADKQVSTEEMELLLNFVEERSGEASGAVWNRAKAVVWIESARPTFATSVAALAKVSRNGRIFALLEKYAGLVAQAGGAASENRRRQLFRA